MDELDQLAGLAAAADQSAAAGMPAPAGAGEGDPGAPPEQAGPGPDEQAADAVNAFAGFLGAYAPDTAAIWTDQARQASAAALSPLFVKYNINMGAIPPELTAAIVVGPLLYRSFTIVGDKMKADRAAKVAAAAPPPAAGAPSPATPPPVRPGAADDAPAVAIHPQMALYQ